MTVNLSPGVSLPWRRRTWRWCPCGKHIPSKGKSWPSCTGARRQPARRSWHKMPRLWVAFPSNSLPVVWARLAQHRFRVLVGTGAARSLIAPAVASSLGLRLVGTERIIGVTGTVATVPLVEVVGMGQMEIPPFRAGILDLGPLRLGIQGILGVNAFAGRRLQVDFPAGRLYLLQ